MTDRLKSIPLYFWKNQNGREPVREWLHEMPVDDRKRLGVDLRTLQFGWPIGMPLVRPLSGGLWELRSSLPSRREARLFFVAGNESLVLVHAIIKKTQKTPDGDLDIARKRLKELTQ